MIEVPKKHALEVSSPAPITSERHLEKYVAVLDKRVHNPFAFGF